MKRFFVVLLIFCLTLCIFSGCQRQVTPLCRVVVGMEISGQHQDLQFAKKYTDIPTIEGVLNCLRSMQSRNKITPVKEYAARNYFLITLHLSDGVKHSYALAGHRYFKAPKKPWVEIKPELVSRFYTVLQNA